MLQFIVVRYMTCTKIYRTNFLKVISKFSMNVQTLAKVFGVVFLLIGILGFVPGITTDGHLLGIFHVDMLHNIIHILTGIIAFLVMGSASKSQMYFKVFGIVYLIVAVAGFVQGTTVLGLIGVNMADNILHIVIALVALVAGFKGCCKAKGGSSMPPSNPTPGSMPGGNPGSQM